MSSYPDLIERTLRQSDLLGRLQPTEPLDLNLLWRVREADNDVIRGEREVLDFAMFALVRGALFYALDSLNEAHAIFQDAQGDHGSYWHGMIHRREGDFDNARYWFRRAGTLPVFARMHALAAEHSSDMARQHNWDPYLFTGQCEQARFGAEELTKELVALQRVEFEALLDYCWRTGTGSHQSQL